ncbi:MAG: peptidase family protein [Acidimicrobiales bacterium]|nr:peptidase family protein [Acidimicrobiales bacterium]
MGGFGRSLITAGTLILLFVAYQLWGTGLQEAKSQDKLDREFDKITAKAATSTTTSTPTTTTTAPPPGVTATTGLTVTPTKLLPVDLPLPKYGAAVAQIKIPKIGITRTVVEGVGLDQLKRGPGHYPETPLPGQAGNAAIAGHRTTYGQPFHNVDKLEIGDQIEVTTAQRPNEPFVYRIDKILIVQPDQTEVLLPTKRKDGRLENRLTLTACEPKYSAAKRRIVSGILIGQPVPDIKGQPEARKRAIEKRSKGGDDSAATIDGGLSGVGQSKTPVIVWGLVCALIWFATWLAQTAVRRTMRRRAAEDPDGRGHPSRAQRLVAWTPYLVGLPIFLVALYVFFENFGRLLPGNY